MNLKPHIRLLRSERGRLQKASGYAMSSGTEPFEVAYNDASEKLGIERQWHSLTLHHE